MQHQHHIHEIEKILWPRCKRVELKDDSLLCILDLDRQYDLIASYQKDPHVQFLNYKSLDDLVVFTRAWGPLYLVESPSERNSGTAVRRVDDCLAHLKWLRAVHQMIQACKGRADWRGSLAEYLAADKESLSGVWEPGKSTVTELWLEHSFHIKGGLADWIASADISSVQRAVAFYVEANTQWRSGLRVEKRGKSFELRPCFEVHSLWDAMQLMVSLDQQNRCSPRVCHECRRIFRPLTAHDKRFCSYECAHRVTNRAWRRKDLRSKKRRSRKGKSDGN
jgi:hypothetical protein